LILLLVLLSSSLVLAWGERQLTRGLYSVAQKALWGFIRDLSKDFLTGPRSRMHH
jgi:hypothetical protein